ncbi:MAG: hypothetical protein HY747_11680 [Elusimicrobia bacterium]|nr:hypothetical protein [Elusimicrobiota bacterium]
MDVNRFIAKRFPKLGINKQREAARLVFEIAKKENIPPKAALDDGKFHDWHELKNYLLQRRYPQTFGNVRLDSFYLPKLEISPGLTVKTERPLFSPKKIVVEEKAAGSGVAARATKASPKAKTISIGSLHDYLKENPCTLKDYNRRTDTLFITHESRDFYKPCPCTKKALTCGFNIINLGFGCPCECAYCYLQEYQNIPGIVLPANPDGFFKTFDETKLKKGIFGLPRIGSGEFCDSLALDHITEYSPAIIEFFRRRPKVIFEFKTKSVNIQNILNTPAAPNVVVSWSLNSPPAIASSEYLTPSLDERLAAAKACAEAGYKVAFHFDPVLYYPGWQEDYRQTIEKLFDTIAAEAITWVSFGTLRFHPPLKKIIENRFPENKMLDAELILGFDGKMRYPDGVRRVIYQKMFAWIKERSPIMRLYLCMEEPAFWRELIAY